MSQGDRRRRGVWGAEDLDGGFQDSDARHTCSDQLFYDLVPVGSGRARPIYTGYSC